MRRAVDLVWLLSRPFCGVGKLLVVIAAATAARWAGVLPNEEAPEVGERPLVQVSPSLRGGNFARFSVAHSLPLPPPFTRRVAVRRGRGRRRDVRAQLGRHVRVRLDCRVILVRGHRDRPQFPVFQISLISRPRPRREDGGFNALRRHQGSTFSNGVDLSGCIFGFAPSDLSPKQNSIDGGISIASFLSFVGLDRH